MVKKIGDKNKIHTEYICLICLRNYGCRKSDYLRHKNRLNPCKPKNNIIKIENLNNINLDDNSNDLNNNLNDLIDYSSEDEEFNLDEKPNYTDILNNIDLDKNDNNLNDNNNNLIIEIMKKMDHLIKQNEKMSNDVLNLNNEILNLNGEIEELKEDNEKLKNQVILYNNTPKNTNYTNVNVNIQINNFSNMDYSKIDKKQLINNLIQNFGKQIFLKPIEDLFVNPEKPENHNLYIADKNRKYVKKYNNGRWDTGNFNIIDMIIDNFVDYYKLSIEEIKQNPEQYNKLKNRIQDKMKYLNYCDLDYLANLEDEQENEEADNKKQIERCKKFREMVYNDIINLLHDKKDIVLKTHKNNIIDV